MDIKSTMSLADCENNLYKKDKKEGNAFDLKRASIYYLGVLGEPELLGTHGDIYQLLEDKSVTEALLAFKSPRFLILTCGWAAPTENGKDPETKPSEHSDRRRVRLSLAVSPEQTVSYLRFKDDPKEVIIAEDGRGTLAEACQELMKQVINKKAGK